MAPGAYPEADITVKTDVIASSFLLGSTNLPLSADKCKRGLEFFSGIFNLFNQNT